MLVERGGSFLFSTEQNCEIKMLQYWKRRLDMKVLKLWSEES